MLYSQRSPGTESEWCRIVGYVVGCWSDTCGRRNSILIGIRAGVEIFESSKKNLRIQKYQETRVRGLIAFCGSSGYPVQLSERPKNA